MFWNLFISSINNHIILSWSFVHFGHGILSYYLFSFLDGETGPDELFQLCDPMNDIVDRIDVKADIIKRNDKHQQSQSVYTNNCKNEIRDVFSGGAGLFTTLVTALVFEVLENSEFLVELFRQNSGWYLYKIFTGFYLFIHYQSHKYSEIVSIYTFCLRYISRLPWR